MLSSRFKNSSHLIKAVLIDITGVLYDYAANQAIPGSVEAMRRLKASGLPFKMVTNQDKDRSDRLVTYLHKHGFDMVQSSDIFAPVPAAVRYMKQNNLTNPHLLVHEKVVCEFDCFNRQNQDPDCVVLGDAGDNYSYANLNTAFRALLNMHKPILISLGSSRFYRFKGELLLDVGPFVKALEHATDVKAVVIGKPSPEYFADAVHSLNVRKENTVMIGDDRISDIEAAQSCGITGILVQTGKNHPHLRQQISQSPIASLRSDEKICPEADAEVPDFAAAVELILNHNMTLNQNTEVK